MGYYLKAAAYVAPPLFAVLFYRMAVLERRSGPRWAAASLLLSSPVVYWLQLDFVSCACVNFPLYIGMWISNCRRSLKDDQVKGWL